MARQKAQKDVYGLRAGSLRSKAASIYARESGATLDEVRAELGTKQVHFNVIKTLRKCGFTIQEQEEAGTKNRVVTRYFLQSPE